MKGCDDMDLIVMSIALLGLAVYMYFRVRR